MYKFQNYPFHEFEHDLLASEIITTRAAIVNDVLREASQALGVITPEAMYINELNPHIPRPSLDHALSIIPNFNEYANIYGYQATRLSLLLHPVHRKIELSAQDAFACWKIINRIWSLFSSVSSHTTSNIYREKVSHCENPVIQLRETAAHAIVHGKVHTYVARCLHFVKNHSENLFCENIVDVLSIFHPLVSLITREINKRMLEKSLINDKKVSK